MSAVADAPGSTSFRFGHWLERNRITGGCLSLTAGLGFFIAAAAFNVANYIKILSNSLLGTDFKICTGTNTIGNSFLEQQIP